MGFTLRSRRNFGCSERLALLAFSSVVKLSGKTTLALTIQKEFTRSVIVVPEAASIVFGGGWPRRKTVSGVQHQQKAIFYVQREVEELLFHEQILFLYEEIKISSHRWHLLDIHKIKELLLINHLTALVNQTQNKMSHV